MTTTVAEEKKQLKDFLDKNLKRIDKLYGEGKQDKFAPETYKLWYEKVRPAMTEGLGWGKGTTSTSSEKPLTHTAPSAKPSTPSAKTNGKSGVSKSHTKAISALKKLGIDRREGPQNVYKGSDGRQFYSNGCMAIRLNDGYDLSSEPKDPSGLIGWQDAVYGVIDKAKDRANKEIDLGFTTDDLKKYIRSVNEKEKDVKPSSRHYTIRIKGYSEKVDGFGDTKWCAGVNAKLLLNTMKQFDNPKFYVGTDVKNGKSYKDSYDQRRIGIYIKGDNGEGVVLPVRLGENVTEEDAPYIEAINAHKTTT